MVGYIVLKCRKAIWKIGRTDISAFVPTAGLTS